MNTKTRIMQKLQGASEKSRALVRYHQGMTTADECVKELVQESVADRVLERLTRKENK